MPPPSDSAARLRTVGRVTVAAALLGTGVTAYSAGIEVRNFVVRRVTVPVLPPGRRPLRVLHISDLHLTPHQETKLRWLRSLADLQPDLVVDTGDNLAHMRAVPALLEAVDRLLDVPGVFVLGSNDYFAPSLRNPFWYLRPDDGRRNIRTSRLPFNDLRRGLVRRGWNDLSNTSARLQVGDTSIGFVGVDDPHLGYDDLASVSGPAPADVDLRMAVTHAPYLRVLGQFASHGWDLIMAGHTHGGQVCLPWKGALVTNCDLDTGRAKGLHRHPARSHPGEPGSSWLHVSAGAGTSPYAPVRLFCRPEATLLTLVSRAG